MQYEDLKYVNVDNKIEVLTTWNVVEGHLEGTVSQIFYLGPSFNFVESRKSKGGEIVKSFPFSAIK